MILSRIGAWCFMGLLFAACFATVVTCSGQPTAPSGLVAKAISSQEIMLTWNDNSSNELGFQVEQSLDGISFSTNTDTSANVIAFAATNLNPGIQYYFRVCAFNGAGNSAYSNTTNATTLTPWVQWQIANFTSVQLTNATVSGFGADPDADGLVTLLEYALNRQPLWADNTNLSWGGTDTILTSNYLTLNYQRNAAAIDVKFGVNISSNLTAWFSGSNLVTGPISVSTNAGFVTEKFRANLPLSSAPSQFMQLTAAYNGVPNSWITGPSLPEPLAEVACAIVDNKLYIFGSSSLGTWDTLAYDFSSGTWTNMNSPRPYPGDHHAAEVFGSKIYLIGGLNGSVDGQVQIYDPAINSWSLGASMPYPAGAMASALIGGKIYVAGGIIESNGLPVGGIPTNAAAVYDPVANTWAMIKSEPSLHGRNHPASATDGTKLYVFGGRDISDGSGNGNNTVQIYDPASNTWISSDDSSPPGSLLSPLPQERGGMGKGVYYNGDFYVMGGETWTGTGATVNNVYNRVDIYNAASNSWRLGTPMLTARHGIFPVLLNNRIYVAGGAIKDSVSYSTVFEIYITP